VSWRGICNPYRQIDGKARRGTFGLYARATASIRKLQTILPSYCTFRLFARPEACLTLLLVLIHCRWCDFQFCICRSCWRGQAYCCDECRHAAKLKNHRKAQRKYRQTERGKKAHREAENRRRHGQAQNKPKNMDDATSTPRRPWAMKLLTRISERNWPIHMRLLCHFCGIGGRIVAVFPRRGYG
jgi:hypothetical protein